MSIAICLDIEMSAWEEKIVSAAFLSRTPLVGRGFDAARSASLEQALQQLQSLPEQWSQELTLACLLRAA